MNEKAVRLAMAAFQLLDDDEYGEMSYPLAEEFIAALDDYIDSRIVASLNRVTRKIECPALSD